MREGIQPGVTHSADDRLRFSVGSRRVNQVDTGIESVVQQEAAAVSSGLQSPVVRAIP
jgi:hypothetical protein